MEKVLDKYSTLFDEIFSQNENTSNPYMDFPHKNQSSLTSYILNTSGINNYGGFLGVITDEELSDKTVRKIVLELSRAIDKDSVEEIKFLKAEYGNKKEFAIAKRFLDKKCKKVWDVFASKNKKINVPKNAMKFLGITNQPSLEFLLGDSLKFFEKDNGSTTVDIIMSILNNKNLSYDFEDIHKFLKNSYQKGQCKYNLITVSYLAQQLDYNRHELERLGIDDKTLKHVFNSLTLEEKTKVVWKKFKSLVQSGNTEVKKARN